MSLYTTERDLREVFSKYGPVADVCLLYMIVHDQQSRHSRGFSFVYLENVNSAKKAKGHASETELDGHSIRVDLSITKRAHTPTRNLHGETYLWQLTPLALLTTEDMVEAMMIRTIKAYHVKEEEDGELLKTEIRYREDGHLLPLIVVDDTDHVPDLNHTHLVTAKA